MPKRRFLKIVLFSALAVVAVCLLVKSFVAIRYAPELEGGGMTLVLKADPLGENLRFDDPEEARYFLHTHPEHYGGDSLPDFIFKVPLPVWLLLLLLLIAVLLRMWRPALDTWWLTAGVVLPPLSIGIAWLYGTYAPTEKTYSDDDQYSYHFAKYNYNKILQHHPLFFYGEAGWEYKAFLYDEIEQKMLASGPVGQIRWESNPAFGFKYWDDSFGFNETLSYDLPRPFDTLLLARREAERRRMEQEEKEIEEYESAPFLGNPEHFYPVIKKWTDFHGLDLSQAKVMKGGRTPFCFRCPDTQSGNPYYRAFTPQDDTANRIEVFYAPDRKRYIDMGIHYKTENGRKVRDLDAYETYKPIYLVDRTLKQTKQLCNWNGEAAFWIDNDTFILVGYDYTPYDYYTVIVCNMEDESVHHCWLRMENPPEKSYHNAVVLKEMGIELF